VAFYGNEKLAAKKAAGVMLCEQSIIK